MKSSNLIAVATAALPSFVLASGTFLGEGSSPGVGMAGAGDVVNTRSAAVMWSNPAAMSGLDSEMITFNALLFNLSLQYKDTASTSNLPGSGDGDNAGGWLPTGGFFWHKPLDEKVSFGFAVGSLGGAKLDYGQWRGDLWMQKNSLLSLQLNPSLSYKINDQWSIGAGVQINQARFEMETRNLNMHNASDTAFGYNLGVFFEPDERLKLGLSYRSKIDHTFKDALDIRVDAADKFKASGEYKLSMPYVAQANLGGSYLLTDKLKVLASVGWQQWSDMDRNPVMIEVGDRVTPSDVAILRNWDDVWQYALGFEYYLNEKWTLRTGISYETSALDDASLQSPDLPVDRQIRFALGAGTKVGQWEVNVFYEYADLGNPKINKKVQSKTVGGITTPEMDLSGEFTDYYIHYIGVSATLRY